MNEVLPQLDRMEQKDWTVARQLLVRCGELGLLSVDVAEQYGGMQLDKATSMIVSERMARSASFATTFGAQANLTILPLSLFGTDAQKRKYLPKLMSGEIVGAYCLSESGSGSDALGAKTAAARQPDGSFVLNGEKMWITNGGFADIFIVFAKVSTASELHRLHRRARVCRRDERQGRAQDGPARLVDDGDPSSERASAGREPARRDRQGTQGRVQRAQFRPIQARRDVRRRRQAGDRRVGAVRRRSGSSSASRSRRSAPSSTSWARWSCAPTRSKACCIEPRA